LMVNNAAGISIISFVIAVGISIGYYQYVFVPEVNAKPILPDDVLNPSENAHVEIVEGAALESNGRFFVPREIRTTIGIDNRIIWTNNDPVAHSVTSDDYVDQVNGKFDSLDTIGLLPPGGTYEFTFTKVGEYPYYCVPHPHMTGKVLVIENFA
jgi:plastocyanin